MTVRVAGLALLAAAAWAVAGRASAHEFILYYGPGEVAPPVRFASVLVDAACWAKLPGTRQVVVHTHSDAAEAQASGRRVSERRAGAVAEALVRLGVDRAKIAVQAHGDSRPALAAAAPGEPLNRRVLLDHCISEFNFPVPCGPKVQLPPLS